MGVDFCYCSECKECHHSDYFLRCELCECRSNKCELCVLEENIFCDEIYICDNCISSFNKDDYDISNEELIEEIIKRQKTDFSNEVKITMYENKINELKNEILSYKLKIKSLKKKK